MRPPRWIPNAISWTRVLLLPVWAAAAYGVAPVAEGPSPHLALVVLVLLGVSDVVDGTLARQFGLTTDFGAALDAGADKAAQVLIFGALTFAPPAGFGVVPPWFFALLVLRDLTMIVGLVWIWRRRARLKVQHRWHGKVMSFGLFALMLGLHAPPNPISAYGAEVMAILVALSLAGYIREGVPLLRDSSPEEP